MNEQQLIEAARHKFGYFIRFVKPDYVLTPFHVYLINHLQAMIDGKITKLALSVPPRHGKSELCSRLFPLYLQLRNPQNNVLAASYSTDFSRDEFGKKVRRLWRARRPKLNLLFPDAAIDDSSQDGNLINFKQGGCIQYSSWEGGMTGKGATNALVIDDIIKNSKVAKSAKILDEQWDWFWTTAMSRREHDVNPELIPVLLLHTRWAEHDLIGRVKDLPGWTYINLPALCDDPRNDPFGREFDEPLWKDKINFEYLDAIRTASPKNFHALYQGQPRTEGGNMIKGHLFERYDVLPKLDNTVKEMAYRFSSWDTACKDDISSNFSVRIDWELRKTPHDPELRLYALDLYRGKPDIIDLVDNARAAWKRGFAPVIEEASSGVQLVQILARHPEGRGILRIPKQGDKEEKMKKCMGFFNDHRIFLPEGASWVSTFVDELEEFPFGQFDDQLDSFRVALQAVLFYRQELLKVCKRRSQRTRLEQSKFVSLNGYSQYYGEVANHQRFKNYGKI